MVGFPEGEQYMHGNRTQDGDPSEASTRCPSFPLTLSLLVFLAPLLAHPAANEPNAFEEAGFIVRHWGLDEGLPQTRVSSMCQTADGYLWLAFQHRLARFDGHEFEIFPVGTEQSGVPESNNHLYEDEQGRLIVAGNRGQAMSVWEDGRFRQLGAEATFVPRQEHLSRATTGHLWKLNPAEGTVYRFEQDQFVPQFHCPTDRLSQLRAFGVCQDQAWVATTTGLYRLEPDRLVDHSDQVPEFTESDYVSRFYPTAPGTLHFLLKDRQFKIQNNRVIDPNTPFLSTTTTGIGVKPAWDSEGNLWLSHQHHTGLFHQRTDGRVVSGRLGRGQNNSLLIDRHGTCWKAGSGGLYQIAPTPFQTPSGSATLPGHNINALSHQNEALWVVTTRFVHRLPFEHGPQQRFEFEGFLSAITPDHLGGLWAADWGSQVMHLTPNNPVPDLTLPIPNSAQAGTHNLLVDRESRLWITTAQGLWYHDDASDGITQDGLPTQLHTSPVFSGVETKDGTLHFPTRTGIFSYQQGQWEEQAFPPLKHKYNPMGMTESRDGSIWALLMVRPPAPPESLLLVNRGDGLWQTLDSSATGLNTRVFGIAADHLDGLWLNSPDEGLIRFSQTQLLDHLAGSNVPFHSDRFTAADGMPATSSVAWAGRGIDVDEKGLVWVATMNGPTAIDPTWLANREQERLPPQTDIQAVLLDQEQPAQPDTAGIFHVPPANQRLTIHYTGIHLARPSKVRFRYQLEGYDTDWMAVGSERIAHYQNVPPGRYQFELTSTIEGNPWPTEVTQIPIQVHPTLWQRTSVRAGAVCAGVLALWGLYRRRVRRLEERQTQQATFARQLIDSQEAERKRIAGELHDSLGQTLLLIKNSADFARRKASAESPQASPLEELAKFAKEGLGEVRAITSNLRPTALDRFGLTVAVQQMVDRLAESTPIAIQCEIGDLEQPWDDWRQITIYRLIQEALNNVIKHAQATQLSLKATAAGDAVTISIQDNGQGFDPGTVHSTKKSTSLGLTGMQERARLAAGSVEIHSALGKGTLVLIRLPRPEPTNQSEQQSNE